MRTLVAVRVCRAVVWTVLGLTACAGIGADRCGAQCVDWSALGAGPANGVNGRVNAVRAFDDGTGPAVYLGGAFSMAGGLPRLNVARWDGSTFTPLLTGLDGEVRALEVFDDGSGPALFAGGLFATAGGQPIARVAKWDGSQWSQLGGGVTGPEVRALKVFGNALYVGGLFSVSGVSGAVNLAAWTAGGWRAVGNGVQVSGRVNALEVHNDGSGPALYLGGTSGTTVFVPQFGTVARALARYDGFMFSSPGPVDFVGSEVLALASGDEAGQPVLYAGGLFQRLGGVDNLFNIARWNGAGWAALAGGVPSGQVLAMAAFDDDLYVGGQFGGVGSPPVPNTQGMAVWEATSGWRAVRQGVPPLFIGSTVSALSVQSDGLMTGLFIGGLFNRCAGVDAFNVLRSFPGTSPVVQNAPSTSRVANLGSTVNFNVTAVGTAPLRYRWRRDGVPLSDSGRLSGTQTAALAIAMADASDFGAYDVVVSNDCGSTVTRAIGLRVDNPCHADFNDDGTLNSQDFFDFVTAFFAGCG